jgi:hypothetical protein
LDDRCHKISDKLAILNSEHVLVEDHLSSCQHRLKAANTPALVAHLEGWELYHQAGLGRTSRTDLNQLARHGRRTRIREPGVSL